MKKTVRRCKACGKAIQPPRSTRKFCTRQCSDRDQMRHAQSKARPCPSASV